MTHLLWFSLVNHSSGGQNGVKYLYTIIIIIIIFSEIILQKTVNSKSFQNLVLSFLAIPATSYVLPITHLLFPVHIHLCHSPLYLRTSAKLHLDRWSFWVNQLIISFFLRPTVQTLSSGDSVLPEPQKQPDNKTYYYSDCCQHRCFYLLTILPEAALHWTSCRIISRQSPFTSRWRSSLPPPAAALKIPACSTLCPFFWAKGKTYPCLPPLPVPRVPSFASSLMLTDFSVSSAANFNCEDEIPPHSLWACRCQLSILVLQVASIPSFYSTETLIMKTVLVGPNDDIRQ